MTTFRTIAIDGLDIFYREAGSRNNPTILLLHGFPTFISHVPQSDACAC
jgi:pimeloyl-ACP methyl ester carboxylesterase